MYRGCLLCPLYPLLSKLNTLDNTDTETIPLSVFVFIDSLAVSALQDAGGYAISRQNIFELHLLIKLFYIGMPVMRTDGHSVGRCTVT